MVNKKSKNKNKNRTTQVIPWSLAYGSKQKCSVSNLRLLALMGFDNIKVMISIAAHPADLAFCCF